MKNKWLAKKRLKEQLLKSNVILHLHDDATKLNYYQNQKFDLDIIFEIKRKSNSISFSIISAYAKYLYSQKIHQLLDSGDTLTISTRSLVVNGFLVSDLFKTN